MPGYKTGMTNYDYLDLYRRASAWTDQIVEGAERHMADRTPCDEWNVETLLNHMLETQRYFLSSGKGEKGSPPSPTPPKILSDNPTADFERTRSDMLATYAGAGVIERTGPSLGIAFADTLLHGWDLATATGQDSEMPVGLAQAAYDTIHGRFTDEQRKGTFKPEIQVSENASMQDQLLAYTGRRPEG